MNHLQKIFIENPSINLKKSALSDHEARSFLHLKAYKWKYGPKIENQNLIIKFEDVQRISITDTLNSDEFR